MTLILDEFSNLVDSGFTTILEVASSVNRGEKTMGNEFEQKEYVNITLPNGDTTRFNREWGGHRFTDEEVDALVDGQYISINTQNTRGIIGSLDWLEYKGYDYYGFAPWDATAYERSVAPFPVMWNNHEFSKEEEWLLRNGDKLLLLVVSNRTGSEYAVQVSYDIIDGERWGIIPHFEEFNMPADNFTRETCLFTPIFSGKRLSLADITKLRNGERIKYKGVSKRGYSYECELYLAIDKERGRWRIMPRFL